MCSSPVGHTGPPSARREASSGLSSSSTLASYDGEAELEEGHDILIDGLRSKGPIPA